MSDSSDIFGPPDEPCEAWCLHCRRVFTSDLMVPIEIDGETHWMCPVPGCGAMGFGMDIFPTDPKHPDAGWVEDEDELAEDAWLEIDEDTDEFVQETGEAIAAEVAESLGSFDPPTDWSPGRDEDDDDDGDALIDDDADDEEEDLLDDPSSDVTHPSRYFTRDDFEKAKAEGIYVKAAEETRQRWRQTKSDTPINEDDIPF